MDWKNDAAALNLEQMGKMFQLCFSKHFVANC